MPKVLLHPQFRFRLPSVNTATATAPSPKSRLEILAAGSYVAGSRNCATRSGTASSANTSASLMPASVTW